MVTKAKQKQYRETIKNWLESTIGGIRTFEPFSGECEDEDSLPMPSDTRTQDSKGEQTVSSHIKVSVLNSETLASIPVTIGTRTLRPTAQSDVESSVLSTDVLPQIGGDEAANHEERARERFEINHQESGQFDAAGRRKKLRWTIKVSLVAIADVESFHKPEWRYFLYVTFLFWLGTEESLTGYQDRIPGPNQFPLPHGLAKGLAELLLMFLVSNKGRAATSGVPWMNWLREKESSRHAKYLAALAGCISRCGEAVEPQIKKLAETEALDKANIANAIRRWR